MLAELKGENKGLYLAIISALISGVAVFLNKEGVLLVRDSDVYTTLKNMGVVVIIFCFFVLTRRLREFRKIKIKDWLLLSLIGLTGGCIPFLFFFRGLSLASSASVANLIHKTLFVWATILAVVFLKEKIGHLQVFAIFLLLSGNILILGVPRHFQLGLPEILILIATIIWAFENILAKILLKRLKSSIVVFGRMFFGSIFLVIYLIFTHKINLISEVSAMGWLWIFVVSAILFAYVVFWYAALKYAPVGLVTSVLVLASPLTSFLESAFRTHKYLFEQILGMIVIAIALVLYIIVARKIKWKKFFQTTSPA